MSCGKPSRVQHIRPTSTCTASGPCAPCPSGNGYTLSSGNPCCKTSLWIDYTPVILTINDPQPIINPLSAVTGKYKIIDGNTLLLQFNYTHFTVGTNGGNGIYQISLPIGLTADFDVSIGDMIVGVARSVEDTAQFNGNVSLSSANTLNVTLGNDSTPIFPWSNLSILGIGTKVDSYKLQAVCTIVLSDSVQVSF
jgi:hypothetical protein